MQVRILPLQLPSFQGSSPGTRCTEAPASKSDEEAGASGAVCSEAGASEQDVTLQL